MTSGAAPAGPRLLGVGLTPEEVALWLASDEEEAGWDSQARDRARRGGVQALCGGAATAAPSALQQCPLVRDTCSAIDAALHVHCLPAGSRARTAGTGRAAARGAAADRHRVPRAAGGGERRCLPPGASRALHVQGIARTGAMLLRCALLDMAALV